MAKLSPEVLAGAYGSGFGVGVVEPKNPYTEMAVGLGSGLAAGIGVSGMGAAAQTGNRLGNVLGDKFQVAKEVRQIGKSYDLLKSNPLYGNQDDVMATIKPRGEEPITWRRGAALIDENGAVVTKGKRLARETGTNRNYGMNKSIYRHDLTKEDMQRLPQIVRNYEPAETDDIYQIYRVKYDDNDFPLTAAVNTTEGRDMSSMYYYEIDTSVPLSSRHTPQTQSQTYPARNNGYTPGDLFLNSGDGGYNNIMSQTRDAVKGSLLGTGSNALNKNSNSQLPQYQPRCKKFGY